MLDIDEVETISKIYMYLHVSQSIRMKSILAPVSATQYKYLGITPPSDEAGTEFAQNTYLE